MSFCQSVFILIFLIFPGTGMAIWAGNVSPLSREALHYSCSQSAHFKAEDSPDLDPIGNSQNVAYDFMLVYPKNLDKGVSTIYKEDRLSIDKSTYGNSMKPALFIYGHYSLSNPYKKGSFIERSVGLQYLNLTPLSELKGFQSSEDSPRVTVRSYFDMIAYRVGLESSTVHEGIQSQMAYYTGAGISDHGPLDFNDLFNEISGKSIMQPDSGRIFMSLAVPVGFAKRGEEPKSFSLDINFYDDDDAVDPAVIASGILDCQRQSDLSDNDVYEIMAFSNHKTAEECSHLIHRTGLFWIEENIGRLKEMAKTVNQAGDLISMNEPTWSVVVGALLLSLYRVLNLRVTAGIAPVPPELYQWGVAGGDPVPGHEKYTLEDVKAFATQIEAQPNEKKLRVFLESKDEDFFEYFRRVVDHIRNRKTIKFNENCLTQEFCV